MAACGESPLLESGLEAATPVPPCPLAGAGLNSGAMAACSGYEAEVVTFQGLDVPWAHPGTRHPTGTSCAHLVGAVSPRGYRAACSHPLGLPPEWHPAAELRGAAAPRPRAGALVR